MAVGAGGAHTCPLPFEWGGEGKRGRVSRRKKKRRPEEETRALPYQKPFHSHAPVPGNKSHIWSHFPGKKKSLSKNIFSFSPHPGARAAQLGNNQKTWWRRVTWNWKRGGCEGRVRWTEGAGDPPDPTPMEAERTRPSPGHVMHVVGLSSLRPQRPAKLALRFLSPCRGPSRHRSRC